MGIKLNTPYNVKIVSNICEKEISDGTEVLQITFEAVGQGNRVQKVGKALLHGLWRPAGAVLSGAKRLLNGFLRRLVAATTEKSPSQ